MNSKRQILFQYVDSRGDCPLESWLGKLDLKIAARIRARLERVAFGNFGDSKSIGGGLYELRFDFGSGYRIYFAKFEKNQVLLLCGGDKSSQVRDIKLAKKFWEDFKWRHNVKS